MSEFMAFVGGFLGVVVLGVMAAARWVADGQ